MVLTILIVLFLSVLRFPLICIDATVVMHYPSRILSYWTPTNIVISPANQHIFIVDMSFNRILHLSPEAIYISTINLPIDQSTSYSPVKLTVDLVGYLYVATGAHDSFAIIYKYQTTDDQLVERIPLSVYVPAALTVSPINGDIYVATTDTNDISVYVLDKSGRQINKFNASNFSPPLSQPTALTMDGTAQRLYVANRDDSSTGRVFVVNPQTGKQLQFYINSSIYRPTAVIVDVYLNIYVADMASNCIVALTSNGTLIRTYTHSLYNPQGLTFSANGNLLLSDTLNNRLVLFDVTAAQVLQIYSSSDPVLISPRLITLLNSGDVYVNSLTDDIQYNILKKLTITNSSANVTQIIDPKPHFGFPVGLALDMKDQIYVTDADIPYGYIHIFASNGTEIGRISTTNPQLRNPHGIATDLQGNIYVADSGNTRVIKLLINGTIIQSYKTTPPLQYVYDVKVRDDGVLYISDIKCACVYQLTNDGKQLAVIQLQGQTYLVNPFITLFPSTTSPNPDLLITVNYPLSQVNQYTPNGTLVASYTMPTSAATDWTPYVSVIDEKRHWLIVAESGGRLMFFDL
jgi:sugar lactone lactonase YvrE